MNQGNQTELDRYLEEFFRLAANALRREDAALRGYLDAADRGRGWFPDWDRGVWLLYEPMMVYVIVRELLAQRFPVAVGWERSYPGQTRRHMDLALHIDGQPAAVIECKKWKTEDGREILHDLLKTAALPSDVRRLFLLVWLDERVHVQANLDFLAQPPLALCRVVDPVTFDTLVVGEGGRLVTKLAVVALLEQRKTS